MSRKQSRTIAFQLVYSLGFVPREVFNDEDLSSLEEIPVGTERDYVMNLSNAVLENLVHIDGLISSHAKGFELNRIYKVDLAVLRLGIAEMFYLDTPNIVAIDSAVELAKKFGSQKSADFVNGVLAAINAQLPAG